MVQENNQSNNSSNAYIVAQENAWHIMEKSYHCIQLYYTGMKITLKKEKILILDVGPHVLSAPSLYNH